MKKFRSGYIAIVGRPNVGKSTLLNKLIGEKISIVSRKAQTTRHRITGILTKDDAQFVFVDTPGFQTKYSNALNRAMNRGVTQTLSDVDVVIFVVEAGRYDAKDKAVVRLLPKDRPVILVVNKTDLLKDRAALLPFLAEVSADHDYAAIVPVSAAKGRQTDDLLNEAKKHLPNDGLMFPEDDLTDKSERFLASEYIREKVFRLLGDELPYATAVEIERFETEGDLRRIFAAIVVDREGHKAIVIGKGGEQLKRIASEARQDMERLFDGKVYLEIWVKVKSGWNDDERLLKSLGYE
ncbi:MAG: GTPase Era [Gammaproteobacteria bacterium]|jgi:GTP-binding protein Era|nr:GTPase Era [Gammaproteobacteria bacterium]MBU1603125.1 GTPase Era [Gammaproteobacteria bacterium]MBU2432645.1 GTPase Era [Gammaproteobacteria bacterium]MBU2451476.1 GTPase Era [Gammaproteobacteria bacterium]PKO49155.1 MAG: GTPase Era [Betaproteobacteria bacterium HGW-Betaproteobacteria-4]